MGWGGGTAGVIKRPHAYLTTHLNPHIRCAAHPLPTLLLVDKNKTTLTNHARGAKKKAVTVVTACPTAARSATPV